MANKKDQKSTKKFLSKSLFLLLFVIFTTVIIASNTLAEVNEGLADLATYESVTYDITVSGDFELIEQSSSASLQSATTNLHLYVQEDNNYVTLISESTSSEGEIADDTITYTFTNKDPLDKSFTYDAKVTIDSTKHLIQNSDNFPIELSASEISANGLEEYLSVTDTIDWENDEIKRRASALAQGHTNLFEALVEMASWVEGNIEYNLSTLNAEASLPASSVLETREGVCDEMTSLFISFSRSLGIPARFVSGLTYTRSDLFSDPWQAHGWAEIYIPHSGWVSFDPTFGQYGFVDATHIPLKYSVDPTEPSIYYEWTAKNIGLESEDLEFNVENSKFGYKISPSLEIETEHYASMVNFGSFNLITANIYNNKNSRQAVELRLIAPEEINILDEKKVIVIDALGSHTEEWIVEVDDALKSEYTYSFPYIVFANSIVNSTNTFNAGINKPTYSEDEITSLIEVETQSLNQDVQINCNYPDQIAIENSATITCEVENVGNQIIDEVKVCITEICESFGLLLSESKTVKETISFTETGYQNLETSVEIDNTEDKEILSILVLDAAQVSLDINAKNTVNFGETIPITLAINKDSIATPMNVEVIIDTGRQKFTFDVEQLSSSENLNLEIDSSTLAKNNQLEIQITWNDALKREYSLTETTQITVEAGSFVDSIKQLFNQFLGFF